MEVGSDHNMYSLNEIVKRALLLLISVVADDAIIKVQVAHKTPSALRSFFQWHFPVVAEYLRGVERFSYGQLFRCNFVCVPRCHVQRTHRRVGISVQFAIMILFVSISTSSGSTTCNSETLLPPSWCATASNRSYINFPTRSEYSSKWI